MKIRKFSMGFFQGLDCCYSILEFFVQLAELNKEKVLKVCVQFPFPKSLEAACTKFGTNFGFEIYDKLLTGSKFCKVVFYLSQTWLYTFWKQRLYAG
jgi:hypothetical protein